MSGRRFKAKDSQAGCAGEQPVLNTGAQGKKGWISAFSKDGSTLLEVTQRGSHSLFAGAGQAGKGAMNEGILQIEFSLIKLLT